MNWTDMTFFQRIKFIVEHGENIFVRAEVETKWQSVAVSELPDDQLLLVIKRLAERPVEPTRVVR